MFGYLRPMKPEMKICEFQAYNAVYCGFCRAMGNSGALLRLTLSYDLTFFSLLALSLKEDFCGYCSCRCPAKLFAKKNCVKQSKELSYAANLAVLLLYSKLLDNLSDRDSNKALTRLMLLYVKPKYKKAVSELPLEAEAAKKYLESQRKAEESGASLDACCDPTAQLLSEFFSRLCEDGEQKENLSRLGYVLGRYIYLLDAADDLGRDIKTGAFNPLKTENLSKEDIEKIKKECELSLNLCISEAQDTILKIRLQHFEPIIKNIIFLGLKNTQNAVLHSKTKKERKLALNGKSV
ncbi:MAG: hypothetical protein IJ027_06055 [Oscillospiraceae bacterium]|nr:hypothetical protein [Oscillospiraceae bacterium]